MAIRIGQSWVSEATYAKAKVQWASVSVAAVRLGVFSPRRPLPLKSVFNLDFIAVKNNGLDYLPHDVLLLARRHYRPRTAQILDW